MNRDRPYRTERAIDRWAGVLLIVSLGAGVRPSLALAQQPAAGVSASTTFTQPLTRNTPGDLAQRVIIDPSARAFAPWVALGVRWTWEAVAQGDAVRPTGGLGIRFQRRSLRLGIGVSLDAAYSRLGLGQFNLLSPSPENSPWPSRMPDLNDSMFDPKRPWNPNAIELTPRDALGRERLISVGTAGQARYTMQPVTDITASADWGAGPIALALETGWRVTGPASRRLWYNAHAAIPVVPMFAVIMGLDRRYDRLLSPSPTRMTLGLEWRKALLGRRSPLKPPRSRGSAIASSGGSRFVIDRRPNGVALSLVAKAATRVDVRSDLTGWASVPMQLDTAGTWRLELAASPGVHRLAMRIDDGAWLPPPGLPVGSDGYGAAVGLLVVDP